MSNDKQKTAVEWFGMEMGKLFAQYHGKIICIGEFHAKRFQLEEQANAMHKEEIIKAHGIKFDYSYNQIDPKKITGEQHYNQTYGGDKQ
jgi:hypothetical protein